MCARAFWRRWRIVAIGGGLAATVLVTAWVDARPDALARHGYMIPVVLAAATGGVTAGVTTAIAAALLHAPFVLPHVERSGLTRSAFEGFVSFGIFLLAGASTGALIASTARDRRRYDTLLRIQRALATDSDPTAAGAHVREAVERGYPESSVSLILDDDLVAGEVAGVDPIRSTLADRTSFIPDLGGHARPRRALLVPIRAGGEMSGVLVFVREGEIDRAERVSVEGLGAYIALALENARLAAMQRRFAAELEAKVAAATHDLHVMDQAKSTFVAVASHELRTPLTALRGFSELLATRTYSSPDVRRYARVMVDESERLSRIIDDLLDLSRLDRGLEPPLRRRRVDVEAALRAVAAVFDRPGVAHRVDVDCAPGVGAVDADPDALDRIVKNLVANAMKYSPPGVVRVDARAEGAMVRFVVADQGPGIAPAALTRIFEPYFRVDESVDAPRGTGLGLAVVKALVEAHGGSVGVESAPEMGTRVQFTMPAVC